MKLDDLTGPQLDELYFTKYKGWKKDESVGVTKGLWIKDNNFVWADKDSIDVRGNLIPVYKPLPPLHKSLDLQEEWIELPKPNDIYLFEHESFDGKKFYACGIGQYLQYNNYVAYVDDQPTKAIAALKAKLKALGVGE